MTDDLKVLKEKHDLRLIVEADLGPAHCRGGRALLWRCPFHNEHKGYSLAGSVNHGLGRKIDNGAIPVKV